MKSTSCPRTWEVEAARDGRLVGDAARSLRDHVAVCAACAREQAVFGAMRAELRAGAAPAIDELAVRRMRATILEAAHEQATEGASEPVPVPRRLAVFAACALFVVAAAAIVARRHELGRGSVRVSVPTGTADWSEHGDEREQRVVLREGTLDLSVRRGPGSRRVIVEVPDGEIEDLGTVFEVSVHGGTTTSLAVTEGEVSFHRRDAADVRVTAGTRWTPPIVETRAQPDPPATPQPTALPIASAQSIASAPRAVVSRGASRPRDRDAGAIDGQGGDRAEEDAGYLRIIALVREGREAEAKLAAREYLRRFPDGFRRVEVGRIAK